MAFVYSKQFSLLPLRRMTNNTFRDGDIPIPQGYSNLQWHLNIFETIQRCLHFCTYPREVLSYWSVILVIFAWFLSNCKYVNTLNGSENLLISMKDVKTFLFIFSLRSIRGNKGFINFFGWNRIRLSQILWINSKNQAFTLTSVQIMFL